MWGIPAIETLFTGNLGIDREVLMDEAQFMSAQRALSERTADGKRLSFADSARMVEEEFDRSGLGDLLEKMPEEGALMTDQETIERAVIGKRVVAVAWLPYLASCTIIIVESITLEGGIVLKLRGEDPFIAVLAEIEENEHADA